MSGSSSLLHIVGDVALLLWGMHMVHTGIIRAFGTKLRHALAFGLGNRWAAFLAGIGVTAILQSSTATALMTTSFVADGIIDLVPALAITLGANVGTTLTVQVLSFDIAWVSPLLIIAGLFAFKRGRKTRTRDLGRVGIGLGLVLLALHLVIAAIEPVEHTAALREMFAALTGDPVLNVLLAAVLTWAAYSSVAVVLLIMSLASTHVITPVAALALVIGANLGNLIPTYLAAAGNNAARRLALGNVVAKGIGCLVALPFLNGIVDLFARLDTNPARLAADFHTALNLAVALAFILPLDLLARFCVRVLPMRATIANPSQPQYLDPGALVTPAVALSNAARETLRMADVVETMLRGAFDALRDGDRKLLSEVGRMDNILDELNRATKLYLTEISREELEEADAQRCADILAFTINLEHIGDVIDKSLRELAAKKIKNRLTFSAEGLDEITTMHARILDNLHLAIGVFVTGDSQAARQLLAEKQHLRLLEHQATENHFRRLREGRAESVETSALHLDIVRDLKRINSHIVSAAYPIVDRVGGRDGNRAPD